MTTTRTNKLEVRSDECFEEISLGAVRRFVAECDLAGFGDNEVVSVCVRGDAMHSLVAYQADQRVLDQTPPLTIEEASFDDDAAAADRGGGDPS